MSHEIKRLKRKVRINSIPVEMDWKDSKSGFIVVPVAEDGRVTSPLLKDICKEYIGIKERLQLLKVNDYLKVGNAFLAKGFGVNGKRQEFLLLVTQKITKGESKPANIKKCIETFNRGYRDKAITSVTFPLDSFRCFKGNAKKIAKLLNEELDRDILIDVGFITDATKGK